MSEDVMLNEAIDAIHQGQRMRARDLLTRLLRADQSNPQYWLWMSSVVETTKEQIFCLDSALRLDPHNPTIQRGLVLLGARPPDGAVTPLAPIRRTWEVAEQEVPKESGLKGVLAKPAVRITLLVVILLVVSGLVMLGLGVFSGGKAETTRAPVARKDTEGPPPTLTSTPTSINFTPDPPTPTPKLEGPPPLWMSLEATYTPTAIYIATPHYGNEAFASAIRAVGRGEVETALNFFGQAVQFDPQAVDIHYYIGELYRQQEEYTQAQTAYEQAIELNPDFGPAYLGLARVKLAHNPDADIIDELDLAIEKDPNLLEAYLERVAYLLRSEPGQEDYDAVLADLETVEALSPDNPWIYMHRAQIYQALGENDLAFENAQKANELDITLLQPYLILGQTAAQAGEYELALEALDTFMTYQEATSEAWVAYGQALYAMGEYSQTLEALTTALEMDKTNLPAYILRGQVYIETGQGQLAVNDLLYANSMQGRSFTIKFNLGRAFLEANRLTEARNQLSASLPFAETDYQKAQVYYYRALAIEAIGNQPTANKEWEKLLDLPEEAIPEEWIEAAEERLFPTPTPTLTNTPRPSRTPSPTKTPTKTPTS
ncbi:tetratricopeptide repeat protein [Chloroflexota bacterium]